MFLQKNKTRPIQTNIFRTVIITLAVSVAKFSVRFDTGPNGLVFPTAWIFFSSVLKCSKVSLACRNSCTKCRFKTFTSASWIHLRVANMQGCTGSQFFALGNILRLRLEILLLPAPILRPWRDWPYGSWTRYLVISFLDNRRLRRLGSKLRYELRLSYFLPVRKWPRARTNTLWSIRRPSWPRSLVFPWPRRMIRIYREI